MPEAAADQRRAGHTETRAPAIGVKIEDEECAWQRAHRALSRLAGERAAADAEEGRWLLAAQRTAAHVHLGFGSYGEYIERLFGYTRRTIQKKLRVAQALEELPVLSHALDTGSLGWSVAREITRVAVAETEQQWLDLARGKTLRQLEELVAGKHWRDEPSALGLPAAKRHVLRFEVEAETFALFREALSALRRQSGEPLNDDSALLSMARHVLGGPKDDGRASYQISLSVCPACSGGQQHASGELVSVDADVVAMAYCDSQHLGLVPTCAANENAFPGQDGSPDRTPGRGYASQPSPHGAGAHAVEAHVVATPAADAHPSKRAIGRYAHVSVAECRVVGTPRMSTCTISSCAPRVAATNSVMSSRCAEPITERPTAARSSSNATPETTSASGMPTAPNTASRCNRRRSTPRQRSSRRCASSAFRNERTERVHALRIRAELAVRYR